MSDKYLLFDLSDEKSKKLGEVISNPTCKKIVNLLAEKELGASEIARELEMPLNTTTYNLSKLIEAGLIEESKSFWSVKGKKMPSYRVVNKAIVISPKKGNVYSKIKGVLPVVLIAGILTGFLSWYYSGRFASQSVQRVVETTDKLFTGASSSISAAAETTANNAISNLSTTSPWIWFALGAGLAILSFIIWNWKKL